MSALQAEGAVLGIDVGCSGERRSTGVCRLDWDANSVGWTIRRCRARPDERAAAIAAIADRPLLAVAIDGPLRRGLDEIGAYRRAERLLTLGFGPRIGKPGQSNTPVGRLLNRHANACAAAVLATDRVGAARHPHAIHDRAIGEAFPSAYLGMLIDAPETLGARRGNRSDVFFAHAAATDDLAAVLRHLLPGRVPATPFGSVLNHDDRAALICALTALGLAARDDAAVGDAQGWIILPPPALLRPWADAMLTASAARCGGGVDRVSLLAAPTLA